MNDGFARYESDGERAEAYFTYPKSKSPIGKVIVIHEVWGFTPFMREVCERLSQSGFLAAAPVLFWRDKELFSPGTIREGMKVVWDLSLAERYRPAKLKAAISERHPSKQAASMLRTLYDRRFRRTILRDVTSLARHLAAGSDGPRLGAMGFSMGGKLALQLASSFSGLRACVVYSGETVDSATVRRIRCPVVLFYGKEDEFMTRALPRFVKDSMRSATELTLRVYPSAGHEFFDETDLDGHREGAATDAWRTSVDFLRRRLAASPVGS